MLLKVVKLSSHPHYSQFLNSTIRNGHEPTRFERFLELNKGSCFILDYGHGPVPYKSLETMYGNWYFVGIETNLNIKVLYFRGTRQKFENRCNDLIATICEKYYRLTQHFHTINLRTLGYVPALLTVDFSQNAFADAIRKDFLKFGQTSYDTGDNILGQVCNKLNYFDVAEFKRARFLSFDYSKWFMKEREKTIERLLEETKNL